MVLSLLLVNGRSLYCCGAHPLLTLHSLRTGLRVGVHIHTYLKMGYVPSVFGICFVSAIDRDPSMDRVYGSVEERRASLCGHLSGSVVSTLMALNLVRGVPRKKVKLISSPVLLTRRSYSVPPPWASPQLRYLA